ncbi:MAG TPA: rhomboid family intramembrane serine protease [Thermoleophilia bacterium]|nr:rhomboid family intramembrane serine protease [Thermoleophilia bacterium]
MSSVPPQPPEPPEAPFAGDVPPDFETEMPDDLEVKHCYRHPMRETGVSCSNCGRPICHECMIPAPVGFRCPECVREQRAPGSRARVVTRAQTRSRWSAGGITSGGLSATKVLVAINVVMFVIELVTGATAMMGGGSSQALVNLGALYSPYVLLKHEYWRMLTCLFLHDGILHIAFNMWALWVIGGFVEAALGRAKFLLVYFVSGFAGSVLVLIAAPVNTLVVGASGAIFGIFGALAVHAFLNRGRDLQSRALLGNVVFLLVINLVFSFTAGFVSWQAHVGGLVVGGLATFVLMRGGHRDPRRPFDAVDIAATLAIVAVLVAVTWWRVTTFVA